MKRSELSAWLPQAVLIVAMVTAARWLLLAFNRTDLFVDESQYWLWGQEFAFGYYSKPPLIAWVIGAVTTLAGSDAPFWVRAPGALFHGLAALILAAVAARLQGPRLALWVAVGYVTLPFVALGSLLISTDTILAPFFAAAIYFHLRRAEGGGLGFAALAGAAIGAAFLAKYAAIYFLIGAAIASALSPAMRIGGRGWLAMLGGFLVTISPNVAWNLANKLTTVSHTMDNVGWVREDSPLAGLNPAGMAEFLVSQFAVFGPLMFGALIWATANPRGRSALLAFSLPALAIVSLQALLDRAYANWAVTAYFAGTIVATAALAQRPGLLKASIAINAAICVLLPVLTLAPGLTFGEDRPLLSRYLGRADLSRRIIAQAEAAGGLPVVARNRDILADLFYTGAQSGLAIYATPPAGRPANHYEQRHALPATVSGPVLFVGTEPPACESAEEIVFATDGGAYDGKRVTGHVIDAACLAGAGPDAAG